LFALAAKLIHAPPMASYALVTWETDNGSLKVGELATGHVARVFAEHLAWIPAGIVPGDPRVRRLIDELPKKLASCAFSLEANEVGTAFVGEVLGGG